MRAQLIVVNGKLEGKKIPLVGPTFRIGRGETCHLRPNSPQVSREHAEFTIADGVVAIRDLGSRNGTLVNGKALTRPQALKDRDLVQVGPLTFQVAFADAAHAPDDAAAPAADPALLADLAGLAALPLSSPDSGDTLMIAAFKDTPLRDLSDDVGDEGYERLPADDAATEEMSIRPGPPGPWSNKAAAKGGPSSDAAAAILRKLMERRKASS